MGRKTLNIRGGLSNADLESRLGGALSDRQRQRLRAMKLMLSGRLSAAEIAARVGIGRAQLFNWKRLLNGPAGVGGFLAIGHGGGRQPRLRGRVLSDFKRRLARGDKVADLQFWLNQQGIGVKTGGVYYWARKLGFRKARSSSRMTVVRPLRKQRVNSLEVRMDQATKVKAMLVAERLPHIPSAIMIEALVRLAERTAAPAGQVGESKQFAIEAITEEFRCSRASLYRWAEKWRRSGTDWDCFTRTECSVFSRREIKSFFSRG